MKSRVSSTWKHCASSAMLQEVHLLALPTHHARFMATAQPAVIGCASKRSQKSAAAQTMHIQVSLLPSSSGGEASSIARAPVYGTAKSNLGSAHVIVAILCRRVIDTGWGGSGGTETELV